MVLPLSGPLSIDDIRGEFGGAGNLPLSDYYRGGGLVPDTPANASIPTSGIIRISDFYGGDATTTLPYVITLDLGRSPGIAPQVIGYSDNTIVPPVWNFPGVPNTTTVGPAGTPRTVRQFGFDNESTRNFFVYLAGVLPLGEIQDLDVEWFGGTTNFGPPDFNFVSGGNTYYLWNPVGAAGWTTLEANTGVVYDTTFYM